MVLLSQPPLWTWGPVTGASLLFCVVYLNGALFDALTPLQFLFSSMLSQISHSSQDCTPTSICNRVSTITLLSKSGPVSIDLRNIVHSSSPTSLHATSSYQSTPAP